MYDLTDRESFENVSMWYDEMNKSVNQKVSCMLVGNKLDMDSRRTVTSQEGRSLGIRFVNLADKYGIPFAETSAKTAQNVEGIFNSLTERMLLNTEGRSPSRPKLRPSLPLSQHKPNQDEYCTCCGN